MNLIGRTIANRYEILEKTGVGGMATVYVAKDLVLNRHVAVKVLKEEFTTDEEFVRRFNTEALSAASLSHANIVSIYDVGNEDNIYYIVMELVRGKTLKQIITEEGALPWKWAVNISIQIGSALEVAHKNNIVHRDIKPHNIIITEDGVAKVTDFGIAKAVSNSTITAFGTTIGSVHYFSPEQAKGGYTDAKSDIYSLGVVMYEMLTGRVPFDSDTSVSVALKHMQEDPLEPIKINEDIPSSVNQIILKAMQKEPMARYQSATAMVKDLNMALKDPEGDFVDEDDIGDGFTRRMDAITEDDMARGKKKKKKKESFFEKHPKTKVLLVILICIILFVASLGITSLVMNATNPKEVQIPNLVGLTEDEAKTELEKINVKYNKINEAYSTDVEAGKIMSQDPNYRDNYRIKEKSTINVIVSKGTETTIIPKVAGLTYDEAVTALEEAKLVAEKIEENSKTVESGIVISQETAANTTANAGDTVKIHVSTGIRQVTVPSVMGKSEADAKQAITDNDLKVVVEYSADTSKENGVVVSQSINEGKEVDENTTITITVNQYTEQKTATITIDLKKIVKAETSTTNTSNTEKTNNEKKAKVEVSIISGEGEGFTKSNVSVNEKVSGTITGSGRITVKYKVTTNNGEEYSNTHYMNLNEETSYTFED